MLKLRNSIFPYHCLMRPHAQSFSIQSCTDPATGFFVGCTALKALLKTLVYVVFTFIICQNTHSTNTTSAFNP